MTVQAVLYVDHIGAVAAKSIAGGGPDPRYGFLEICSGNGVELIRFDGSPAASPHDCPVCENASMMAFDSPAALPAPDLCLVDVALTWSVPRSTDQAQAHFPCRKPIRAPPVAA